MQANCQRFSEVTQAVELHAIMFPQRTASLGRPKAHWPCHRCRNTASMFPDVLFVSMPCALSELF